MSLNGQGTREVPGTSVPGRARSSPSLQRTFGNAPVRTRTRCRLPGGRVARNSRTCRCNFWIPRNGSWRRTGKHHSSRSTFHVVCCSMAREQLSVGRLLILSDNLALVLALCKGCLIIFTLLSVMRRIIAFGFSVRFVLSLRWKPSALNNSDKGSRFFDCCFDSSK